MIAFEEYVALYSHELSRFCLKLCKNREDAEDLFQETWTRALKAFSRYQEEKPFRPWLFSICVNIYKNSLKFGYQAKRHTFSSKEEEQLFFEHIPHIDRDLDSYLDLSRAIASLSKKHQVVITLYYFRDFTLKEIAQILHIPEGTVSSRLNSAKKLLKRRLSDEPDNR